MKNIIYKFSKRPRSSIHLLYCSMTCRCVKNELGSSVLRYGLIFRKATRILKEYPDLSGNPFLVQRLMKKLNKYRISYLHIEDIIEDFLATCPE